MKLLQDKEVAFAKVLEKLVHEWDEAEAMSSSASQVNPNQIHLEAGSEDLGSQKDAIQNAENPVDAHEETQRATTGRIVNNVEINEVF